MARVYSGSPRCIYSRFCVRVALRARSYAWPREQASARAVALSSRDKVKLRIAVDVDEVLGRFVYALNQYCKEEHGISREVEDFWIYEFAKIWNCDQDRSNEIVHSFFKSPHFNDGIPALPGAFEVLQRLKEHHDLVVVTSRQHIIEKPTLEWLDRHFPDTFAEVHFGNHFALEGKSRKKSEICQDIDADVLIDDNPIYAHDCAVNGMHVLLFNWNMQYRWAALPPSLAHENITVVRHWEDVENVLQKASINRVLRTQA